MPNLKNARAAFKKSLSSRHAIEIQAG